MTEQSFHPAAAYVAFYEALSPETVDRVADVAHDNIHFKDPFSEIRGVDAYRTLLEEMFRAAPDIRFTVRNCAYDGDVCFLRWTSKGTVKRLGNDPWVVDGMSELRFAPDGRVIEHFDHWDASTQFYMRIPFIGTLIRLIRRRVGSH